MVQYSKEFLKVVLPQSLFHILSNTYRQWLNQMKQVHIPLIISTISMAVFLLASWVFIVEFQLDIMGIAYATAAHGLTKLLGAILYIYFNMSQMKGYLSPTYEIFHELGEFARLALASVFVFCLGWLCYELYVFVAGTFGSASQAAASVLLTLLYFGDVRKNAFMQGSTI